MPLHQTGNADQTDVFIDTTDAIGVPPWCSGSVLDNRSLPPVFESRRGHIWSLFHIWLRFISFGGCSAHLAYHVHKSGRKTPNTNWHYSDISRQPWLVHLTSDYLLAECSVVDETVLDGTNLNLHCSITSLNTALCCPMRAWPQSMLNWRGFTSTFLQVVTKLKVLFFE